MMLLVNKCLSFCQACHFIKKLGCLETSIPNISSPCENHAEDDLLLKRLKCEFLDFYGKLLISNIT